MKRYYGEILLLLCRVSILGVCKSLIGNIGQRLKMIGTKTIYNRMFLKCLMYIIY